jgi:hypothetical protein
MKIIYKDGKEIHRSRGEYNLTIKQIEELNLSDTIKFKIYEDINSDAFGRGREAERDNVNTDAGPVAEDIEQVPESKITVSRNPRNTKGNHSRSRK